MIWTKIDKNEEALHLTDSTHISVGRYDVYGIIHKSWQVIDSDIAGLFNYSKRFKSKKTCKAYVERKIKRFYQELRTTMEGK